MSRRMDFVIEPSNRLTRLYSERPENHENMQTCDIIKSAWSSDQTINKCTLPDETAEFITQNMILRRAQYFGPAHWGVLLGLAIVGESTFAQLFAWLNDDLKADISSTSMRESIRALETGGYIEKSGEQVSSKGPRQASYVITKFGLAQVERAPTAPIAHAV